MARREAAAPLPMQRSDTEVNLMHADWFASRGQIAQAVGLYRTVATHCRARGDHRRAVTAFASIVRLEGPGSDARLQMGECLLEMGQRADAARTLDQAAYEMLARNYVGAALHAFRLAAEAEPSASRWRAYVDWSTRHGHRDDALRHLAEVMGNGQPEIDPRTVVSIAPILLEVIPGHVPTLRRLAAALLSLRRVHQAVDAIRTALQIRPLDPVTLELMAEAFAILRKPQKAGEVMLRLAQLVGGGRVRRVDEARRIVHRGLQWDPRNAGLQALRREFDDRPVAVARQIVVRESIPALDLSDLVEVMPYDESIVAPAPLRYGDVFDEPSPTHGMAPMIPFPA